MTNLHLQSLNTHKCLHKNDLLYIIYWDLFSLCIIYWDINLISLMIKKGEIRQMYPNCSCTAYYNNISH